VSKKEITVAFYLHRFPRDDWRYDLDESVLGHFFEELNSEFSRFGIHIGYRRDDAITLDVKGYGDLLNSVRIRSPQDNIANLCLGHIIGTSPNCDLFEDIRRGVNRVAFAPETVEPEGSSKIVCHNCGCGC
jgi:hypothetical protein